MKKIALNKETVRKLTHNDLKGAVGGYVEPCEYPITKVPTVVTCVVSVCNCTDPCYNTRNECGGPTKHC